MFERLKDVVVLSVCTVLLSLDVAGAPPIAGATWNRRLYRQKEIPVPVRRDPKRRAVALLPVDFARSNEFFCQVRDGWVDAAEEVVFTLTFPEDFPKDALVYFSAKDWDSLWYNYKGPRPEPGTEQVITVPMFGEVARKQWKPGKHLRPWNPLSAHRVRELGVKFDLPAGTSLKWSGEVRLEAFAKKNAALRGKGETKNLTISGHECLAGQTFEVSFETTIPFKDPFDTKEVSLKAEIIGPTGDTELVDCFYYEDFLFDKSDKFGALTPSGYPQFRMRYAPREPGLYEVRIKGRVGKQAIILPALSFTCKKNPKWKGVIQRMPDSHNMLSYSQTGEEFFGLGLNVRSPFDTRYRDVFPGTKWEPYNLNMYEELFKKYKANGINVVEVWMSSWWLGLEWIPDAPGNHGVGHMNQWRAWKLDRLLEWAEKYDVYVILAIHNHGKFSMWCDQEWERNPFNLRNGGYLTTPAEFFTSPRAQKDFKRFSDYLLSRWAHSSRIMAWKLFTEVDLTGERPGEYRRAHVANWHRRMGRYVKDKDPNKHLVTTHWSTDVTKAMDSPTLASLKELDMLTLDAYYLRRGDTQRLLSNLDQSLVFQRRLQKPCIVTEFGGTPWADSIALIKQQLHFVTWYGFFRGFPIPPMLWWFPLIEEENLYSEYKSLSDFGRGESRADVVYNHSVVPTGNAQRLEFYQIVSENRMLGWVVDQNFLLTNRKLQTKVPVHKNVVVPIQEAKVPVHRNVAVPVQGLRAGGYKVSFHDCKTGKVVKTVNFHVSAGGALSLPEFKGDLAFKIVPLDEK